jgi:addiction module HigA family antidote
VTARTPVHPGDILFDEMDERRLSVPELVAATGLPEIWIVQILHCKRDINPEIARALATYLGTSTELWTNLQTAYDRDYAKAMEAGRRTAERYSDTLARLAKS